MIGALSRWLDRRIGYNKMLADALYEPIPGGARWRYITGSMLVFAFVVQAITGTGTASAIVLVSARS